MKTHLKKAMALLLSIAVALSMMSMPAFAQADSYDNSTSLADGTYTIDADHYVFTGGTGKAKLTCTKVTVKNGKATGEFTVSSTKMTHTYLGHVNADSEDLSIYDPSTDTMGPNTYKITNQKVTIPVKLNQTTDLSARSTAMTETHWIDYQYTITIADNQQPDEPAQSEELTDGTYTASGFQTDVTTPTSGMIMVNKATVVIKDGKATAIVTMKGTGADRLYISDTATADTIIGEAVEEETKEVGGSESKLLGGLELEGDNATTFWPIPITLGEPRIYAARSASHFAKQDKTPDKYYYVHDFQIDKSNLTRVSDSTEIMTPQQDAERYMDQYYGTGSISTDHPADIKGKNNNVTMPYYDTNAAQIKSFKFKRGSGTQFRAGWFIDKSILNTTYFSSSNLKKIRYPEGNSGTVTFSPKATYRDSGMTFTATLKLYPADSTYNQYDATGVYYDKEPLAERTFNVTVQDKPIIDFNVTVAVTDMKTKEAIENPAIRVVDEADNTEVTPNGDGTFKLNSLKKYTIYASKNGFVAQGGAQEVSKTGYSPAKEETITLSLLKEADSMHTVGFQVKDQFEDEVSHPTITVTRGDETIAPEANGSYRLYDGIQYRYSVAKDGYETKTNGYIKASEDMTEMVTLNKYLESHQVFFNVYDEDTNEVLKDVIKTVTVDGAEVTANQDGSYTIPDGKRAHCDLKLENYQDDDVEITASGFEVVIKCTTSMKITYRNQLKNEIDKATTLAESIQEGDAPLEYPTGTKSTLQAAIAAAQEVLAKEDATEATFQEELSTLKKAENATSNAQNPDEATVLVRINQKADEPGQLMELKVTGDDVRKHKYVKPSSVKKQVTILDVMVAVHEKMYGEAFNANPTDFLEQYDFGMYVVTKIFGKETNQTSYRLNNAYVDHMAYQKTVVHSGDLVTIKLDKGYSDRYLYAEPLKAETPTNAFTATLYEEASNVPAAASGYKVTLADTDGHEVNATSDENGKLDFTFTEDGTYTVKSVSKEGLTEPITVPYMEVKAIYHQLTAARDEAQTTTNNLIDLSDYRQDQQAVIAALQDAAKEKLQNATTLEEVETIMKELRDSIAEQKTDREILTEEKAAAEAAAEDLKAQNTDLQNQNTDLQNQNTDLQNQITDLEAQNAAVADQLARLETQLKELQCNLKNAITSGLQPKVYNGKAQTQNPVITLNGKKLVAGRDYVIAYASNKNIGTATMIVSGKGNYTGSLQATFDINPSSTRILKAKAKKTSIQLQWKASAGNVTGYQVMYSKKNNFRKAVTKTVTKAGKKSLKLSKLSGKSSYHIKVRAYKKAGSRTFYSNWSKVKTVKTK